LKKKHSKIGLYESMLCADRIFSPAAEFFGWSRRNFFQLVGNTGRNRKKLYYLNSFDNISTFFISRFFVTSSASAITGSLTK
jgi:hypothetical protein